jgi:hypothetical protein
MEFMDTTQAEDLFTDAGKVRHDATIIVHPYQEEGDETKYELFGSAVRIKGEKGDVIVGVLSNMLCIWPADKTADSINFGGYGQDVLDFAQVPKETAEVVYFDHTTNLFTEKE